MVQRTKRHLSRAEGEAFLAEAAAWRQRCIQMLAQVPIGEPFYESVDLVLIAIDNVALAVTGDQRYLHRPMHSIQSNG